MQKRILSACGGRIAASICLRVLAAAVCRKGGRQAVWELVHVHVHFAVPSCHYYDAMHTVSRQGGHTPMAVATANLCG